MKKGKKIVIGVAAVAVVAGGFYAVAGGSRGEAQLPQVSVTKAETGDVEEIVDATGTVVSDEQKTFYSPVNAQIKNVSFAEGDSVSKGTKLVEFELKDLERDNQKAELNVKSGEYDYKNSINKSDEAQQKQNNAKSKVSSLEQQVKDKAELSGITEISAGICAGAGSSRRTGPGSGGSPGKKPMLRQPRKRKSREHMQRRLLHIRMKRFPSIRRNWAS